MNTILMLMFLTNTKALNLPTGLLESICFVESGHNIEAIAPQDGGSPSLGICQVKFASAQMQGFKGTPRQLMTPEVNIHYAAKILKYQILRYPNNYPRAITAYNKGRSTGSGYSVYYMKVKRVWDSYAFFDTTNVETDND